MNPYGPYRSNFQYELAALMRKYDMEPSLEAQRLGRKFANVGVDRDDE